MSDNEKSVGRGKGETMERKRGPKVFASAALLIGAIVANGSSVFAAQPETTDASANRPVLAPPTEDQLKRGRDFLDKLSYIIENVSLRDAAAVMKVFGFSNLDTAIYPTYVRVQPVRSIISKAASLEYLAGTGFEAISVDPLVRSKSRTTEAVANARFDLTMVCVSIDDVRARFGHVANIRAEPTRLPPGPRPRDVHDTGYLTFEPLQTPEGMIGRLGFRFDYQVCAKGYAFAYDNFIKGKN